MNKAKDLLDTVEEIYGMDEMANTIIPKYSGLVGSVWITNKEETTNQQSKSLGRVKLRQSGGEVFVTIKKNKDGKRLVGGKNQKMIKDLLRFVEKNEKILWEWWETPTNENDFVEFVKKIKKV